MYLTGCDHRSVREAAEAGAPIGYLAGPGHGSRAKVAHFPFWAADNGCYTQGDRFDLAAYLEWLAGLPARERCLFATAPDVVADAAATWERSAPVLPVLRGMGYAPALVAQDGIERTVIDWSAFDVLFIGGTTAWKLSHIAYALIGEAKGRGKRVHVGRVNSLIRLRAMCCAGADSADGTMIAYGPDKRLPQLLGWLAELARQPHLEYGRATFRLAANNE
jgi:hypothetical protein